MRSVVESFVRSGGLIDEDPTACQVMLEFCGIARRMVDELKTIAADQAAYRGDWKTLQGSTFWRLRVGDWRAI